METPVKIRYTNRVQKRIQTFKEKDKLRKRNRELVLKFVQDATSRGVGELRLIKYFGQMKYLDNLFGKDFDKATIEDIKRIVGVINTSDFKEWTKWSYRVMIKSFWKWIRGTDEYPSEVKWIKAKQDKGKVTIPEDLITRKDLKKIIQFCISDKERCIVTLLYESGVRLGELLNLRIKNIDFHSNPAKILVHANKTKTKRKIPIVESVPYVTRWLETHPERKPESFVFVNTRNYISKQVRSDSIYKFMERVESRLNNGKHIYPHLFRHSRATELANHLTEAQMNKFFGWTPGSDMPSVYVHLSGRDIDNAILGIYGQKKDDEKLPEKLVPQICPRCKENCLPTETLCLNCGLPLTEQATVNHEKNMQDLLGYFNNKRSLERLIENMVENKLTKMRITV